MDINRIKELAGLNVVAEAAHVTDPKIRVEFKGVRPSDELDFRRLASKMGGRDVEMGQKGNTHIALVTFKEEHWKESNQKYQAFKKAWEAHKSGVKESEEDADTLLEEKMTAAQKSEDLEDACWDGYEAVGTKEKDGKTVPNCVPVNEDHGKGFYVMVDGKEHCWCETKKEADEKAAKLKDNGKKATVVPDKDIKESEEHEEDSDNTEVAAKKGEKESEEKAEAEGKEEVKEAVEVVDNFVQDDTDKDNELAKRTGVDSMMKTTIKIPDSVRKAVTDRISELEKSIKFYDDKGYNDHSQKEKAIECLKQVMDNLAPANVEALKKAQVYFGTLMSPITDLFPAQLVNFLANAQPVKAQRGGSIAELLNKK